MSLFLQFIVALFSHSGESIYDDPFLFRLVLNLIYQNGMIPTIKKLTRVTKKTATAIDHIITNSFVENTFKTAIIKSDVSDHFPICIFFLQQTYLQKMMLSINIKELLMIKKLKLCFKISINMTCIPSKPIRMQTKLTIISYQHFVEFMIFFSYE